VLRIVGGGDAADRPPKSAESHLSHQRLPAPVCNTIKHVKVIHCAATFTDIINPSNAPHPPTTQLRILFTASIVPSTFNRGTSLGCTTAIRVAEPTGCKLTLR
jgi:hypothetical protein